MSDKLKLCPFCGSEDVKVEYDGIYRWANCQNSECDASTKVFAFLVDAGNTEFIAGKVWNTRPIEDALRSAISAVEQENVGYKSMMQSEALEKLEPGQLIAIIHSKQDEIEKAESDFALCMEQYDHQQERACNAEASLHEANKDAERLSMVWYFWDYYNSVFRCIHCKQIETDSHLDTCAWILHRARLAKKEQG
jgi:hypothetical protein